MAARQLSIFGVGFLGGSLGLAARQRGLFSPVLGVDSRPEHLAEALRRGAIDAATSLTDFRFSQSDIVVVCTPVDTIAPLVLQLGRLLKADAVITDVGSTKAQIVREISAQAPGLQFVGSHPLAGSEMSGAGHADARLLSGRCVVVTPTSETPANAITIIEEFWQALGATVRHMTPEAHDEALAKTSHLPHLTACALAQTLPEEWRDLAASGFRDTTRVAAGDPAVWTPIFQQNRQAILAGLADLLHRLIDFHEALTRDDALAISKLLQQGKQVRDALGR